MIRDRIMTCYVCGKEATRRCPRCAKPYCDEHGEDLCAACQDPASAIPSGTVFRGSLLALLVASVLALWLLIQPPGLPGGEAGEEAVLPMPTVTPAALTSPTPTPAPTRTPTATPSPTASPTPGATVSPTATPAPEATPTLVPTPTPEPSPFIEYEIQAGDTLSSIAQAYGTTIDDLVSINGLASQDVIISVGQKLLVPNPAAAAP
ncbi:MAG: LysM peptidoglycan-binding domain-containing protein [Dehalococcoidia bacterium]|nr:MAG: LysM peptidoglycan-binding domain-containing protein [Dehalococcoidia bacterium]